MLKTNNITFVLRPGGKYLTLFSLSWYKRTINALLDPPRRTRCPLPFKWIDRLVLSLPK